MSNIEACLFVAIGDVQNKSEPQWKAAVLEDVAAHFQEQIAHLLESEKNTENTLRRRNNAQTNASTNANNSLSGIDKIFLQVRLDVTCFRHAAFRLLDLPAPDARNQTEEDLEEETVSKLVPSYIAMTTVLRQHQQPQLQTLDAK